MAKYDTYSPNKIDTKTGIKNGTSCQTECQQNDDCKFWSYTINTKSCFLLKEDKEPRGTPCKPDNCKRGPKECPPDSDENGEYKTKCILGGCKQRNGSMYYSTYLEKPGSLIFFHTYLIYFVVFSS